MAPKPSLTYSRANLKDVDRLFAFILPAAKELSLGGKFPVSQEKTKQAITEAINDGIVIICQDRDIIKGVLMLAIFEYWWSEKQALTNALMYVDPKSRTLKITSAFIEQAKIVAENTKMNLIWDFIDATENLPRKVNLAKRKLGLTEIGVTLA